MDIQWLQNEVQKGKDVDWEQYGYVKATYQGDFVLFNYTVKAEIENRWNWFERNSRGLILNWKTGEVVAWPFPKSWNWFQGGRTTSAHIVTVTEKVDGSMGVLYRQDEMFKIATRGSFESEQALFATEWLNGNVDLSDCPNEYTLIFEIVYPENRVVVDYKGFSGLYLLAIRNRFTGEFLPFYPDVCQFWYKHPRLRLPTVYNFNNITDIIAATDSLSADYEGWVVEFSDGQRFKFKGDRYLELHKIVTNITFNRVLEHCQNGTYNRLLYDIPDEFLEQIKEHKAQIDAVVESFTVRVEDSFENAPKDNRKQFALWCKDNCQDLMPYMFLKLDGRDYVPFVLRREF